MQKRLFSYTEDTYPGNQLLCSESILNRLLIRWLNSLNLWKKLSVESFVKEFSNGLLLIKIIKFLKPSTKFPGIYEKPLAKKACMHNIEQGLSIIWQLNAKKRVSLALRPSSSQQPMKFMKERAKKSGNYSTKYSRRWPCMTSVFSRSKSCFGSRNLQPISE